MEKILYECYNGDVSDKLYLYLSMIITNSEERKEIIRNNGDEVMEDFSEKLMNMSEEEYYKGWMSVEEANLSMAKKMLEEGEPIEKISKFTGLSIEAIEKLK